MWPDDECLSQDVSTRPSTSSDPVVEANAIVGPFDQSPSVANMNFTNSKKIHIGHKIIKVTQNVHNNDVVEGRFLCLELVSPAKANRLRCSVAVFVCWALVVVILISIYLLCFGLSKPPTRLRLELSLPRYLYELLKNTSTAERVTCSVALILVILCNIFVVIYFTVIVKKINSPSYEVGPHEWAINRDQWLARSYNSSERTRFRPLKLVVVQHTVSNECHSFLTCAAEMRNIQDYFLDSPSLGYDIPYNFVIGNDGRVYEGRGWDVVGAHTAGYNLCSLGIGFVGDYREEKAGHTKVNKAQMNKCLELLKEGVKFGYLDPSYAIVGAKDLKSTASPGSNLYNAIKQLPHYDHLNQYRNKTCTEVSVM